MKPGPRPQARPVRRHRALGLRHFGPPSLGRFPGGGARAGAVPSLPPPPREAGPRVPASLRARGRAAPAPAPAPRRPGGAAFGGALPLTSSLGKESSSTFYSVVTWKESFVTRELDVSTFKTERLMIVNINVVNFNTLCILVHLIPYPASI